MAVFSGPARGFDARIVDFHSTIGEVVPLKHLAVSLGVRPRKGEDRLMGGQCQVLLQQIAEFTSNLLVLPKFEPAPKKPAEDQPTTSNAPAAEGYQEAQRFRRVPHRGRQAETEGGGARNEANGSQG
ncbi:unnamed protein product [Haemonchus placei]|uniref:RMI1_N domain-containing protein n=1 Tax=Haemonchus placei TaxID=6290 RepID=A0A0N4VTS9_HAEPC|nr:unnamed protein product [Haemonchus placei]